jgi:hypothetical protein
MTRLLAGKRVLVVEDHIIISMDLAHELAAQEAKVMGRLGLWMARSKQSKTRTWTV